MRAVEATAHVGADGMLRIEVAVNERRDQEVRVAVVIESPPQQFASPSEARSLSASDPWARYRTKLEAAGGRVPQPESWSARKSELLRFEGSPISQSLVEDRR